MDYILVVDDDPDARFIIRTMVEFQAYRVVEASNGQEALDRINEQQPALIFLDLMMPVMDGFSVLNRLQAAREWRDIPVVVVSAMQRHQMDNNLLPGIKQVMAKGELSLEKVRDALTYVAVRQ